MFATQKTAFAGAVPLSFRLPLWKERTYQILQITVESLTPDLAQLLIKHEK